MAKLKIVEKRILESFFQIDQGYVLNFTNASFEEFFKVSVGINIYSDKYETYGNSKARRLKSFLEVESDEIVGTFLLEAIELWKHENPNCSQTELDQCIIIANKLLNSTKNNDPDRNFLEYDFSSISLQALPINSDLISILDHRLQEAYICLNNNSLLSVVFLCGSILEGILLGFAQNNMRAFNLSSAAPKDANGNVKSFYLWTLSQFIDAACELNYLTPMIKKFSHVVREFRNYIHPHEQYKNKFIPDKHTAEICLKVVEAAIDNLQQKERVKS